MKSKTRYNIRLARRRGVEVRVTDEKGLEEWHRLHRETARRKGIVEESSKYFEDLFMMENPRGRIRLLQASRGGGTLAAAVIARYKDRAYYLYGASSARERRVMAPYALQWACITYAREAGCRSYDLYGIPPSNDPSHPMWGLYRFKTGFGGKIRHYRGCWDYPFDRELYKRHAGSQVLHNPYHR
jgi:lipid II:glycine glycyltransferase (peptidoglycan interpeptide bridge formation enzyme)